MDFNNNQRKRGKDKEMNRRKRNGGKSTKHVRITEAMNENKSKNGPKKHNRLTERKVADIPDASKMKEKSLETPGNFDIVLILKKSFEINE